jgi:hypothetical protein
MFLFLPLSSSALCDCFTFVRFSSPLFISYYEQALASLFYGLGEEALKHFGQAAAALKKRSALLAPDSPELDELKSIVADIEERVEELKKPSVSAQEALKGAFLCLFVCSFVCF